MEFKNFDCICNIYYLTPQESTFSDTYISVRNKEQRFLTDHEIKNLPFCKKTNPHYKEWQLRQQSTNRFIRYIKKKKQGLTILEIGCGNGWFTNRISEVSTKNEVIGLDINSEELEQASRVFKKGNLQFVYGDIYKLKDVFKNQIDIVVLNASVQYFSDFSKLIILLNEFLKPHGEIHIIDSPFYDDITSLEAAKQRTKIYYENIGFPEMAKNYFHHLKKEIKGFQTLYTPTSTFFYKILRRPVNPFYWVKKIK